MGSVDCAYVHSPPINPDIGGIGVRVSFYLQTLFLGCLSVRSGSVDDVTGSMHTLIATNMAMAMAIFILGFRSIPEISLQDALVVLHLLFMSWLTVTFSLAFCGRFPTATVYLQGFSILQTYLISGLIFLVLGSAGNFGSFPLCNNNAKAVFLRPFPFFQTGRIVGCVLVGICVAIYSAVIVNDLRAKILAVVATHSTLLQDATAPTSPPLPDTIPPVLIIEEPVTVRRATTFMQPMPGLGHRTNKDGKLIMVLILMSIFWMFCVLNTELLIRWNFDDSDTTTSSWQFGQILPMLLVVVPLTNVIKAFREFGLRRIDYH